MATKASKAPRKSRAAPRYSLRAAPFVFWHVLFPEVAASFEKIITGWVVAGMLRGAADDKLNAGTSATKPAPADWLIRVDDKGVTLSFPKLRPTPEFSRPLLLKPDLLHVPSFREGHPIERLKASPSSRPARENVAHLLVLTVSEIDRILLAALKSAIERGDLVVTGILAGNPLATRSPVRLGDVRRAFDLDIENNRIRFDPGTPDLIDIEVSRIAAEPGKARSMEQLDAPFAEKLMTMLESDPELGLIEATLILAHELPGRGAIESKADRLRRRFKRMFPDWKRTRS